MAKKIKKNKKKFMKTNLKMDLKMAKMLHMMINTSNRKAQNNILMTIMKDTIYTNTNSVNRMP